MSGVSCHMSGVRCQVSGIRCHMSGVRCQVSHVPCHVSPVTQPKNINGHSNPLEVYQIVSEREIEQIVS